MHAAIAEKPLREHVRNLNVRIDADDKARAEVIFSKLGLTPTEAVRIFYRQTVNCGGLPFDMRLPQATIEAIEAVERGEAFTCDPASLIACADMEDDYA